MTAHQVSPRFQRKKKNHGIPVAPLAKRSPDAKMICPVVYVDCEIEAIDLPFADDSIEANVKAIRQKRERDESNVRFWRRSLILSLAVLLLVLGWIFIPFGGFRLQLSPIEHVSSVESSFPDSQDNVLGDQFEPKDFPALRTVGRPSVQ